MLLNFVTIRNYNLSVIEIEYLYSQFNFQENNFCSLYCFMCTLKVLSTNLEGLFF